VGEMITQNTTMRKTKSLILSIICTLFMVVACQDAKTTDTTIETEISSYKVGSICTIENGDGDYGVAKVLAIADGAVHVKIYKNKYKQRPTEIELSTMSMGSITDPDGFGLGHIPLQKAGFDKWNPEVVTNQEVTQDELEGYHLWKSQ
jgi:hypothetical protein